MRASRLFLALVGVALVSTLAPTAQAYDAPKAQTYAVVAPDSTGMARVIVVCTATAPPVDSALSVIGCDLYDSSARPSIHHERMYSGGSGVCVINAFLMQLPVEYCTTVTTTYQNSSTQTAQQCGHSGGAPPPHNAPAAHNPSLAECLDAVGLPV